LISFNEERSGGYYRDNFDIKGMINGVNKLKLKMPKVNSLSKIVIYKKSRNTMRLSLRSKYHNLKTVYFFHDNRITIKVVEDVKLKKEKVYPTIIANNSRKKIIVIDPGHGGRDIGAQGPKNRYEKKSVLMVAKTLRYILKSRGYTVYMTRDSDTYKTLKYRTSYANHKNADLFISIHANAVPKRKRNKIFGIETYYLSPARSERAKRVALHENQMNVQSLNYSTKNIFLMTQNRAKITASNKLAVDVQSNILYNLKGKYKYIKDNGVRKGPFWVLVGVQMPSILVEIGYISHYRESIRLYNSSYQNLLARGIANGIDDYFRKNQ
jgi:N-acetylmuramoyl-L-alanine amidase